MANEITLDIRMDYSNAGTKATMTAADQLSLDVDALGVTRMTQSIGTGEEALDLGALTTPGMLIAVNRSTTRTISIRAATGETDLASLKPGEPCCFRLAASAPFVVASGAGAVLDYMILED